MAFVHALSCECAKSELDLFSIPPTQTSIDSGSWYEYNPISSISDGAPIEFVVGGAGTDYIDMANSQLFVRAQILNADNTDIDNNNHVGPVNLFLHSLFSEVDVKLNDTLVSSTNNTYSYRSYIETLLSYGSTAKQSQLTSALYYKDVAGHMENANPHDANARNLGFKKRFSFVEDSRVVDMVGTIHNDLFFQDKYIPNDVGVRIRLVRQKDAFALMSSVQGASFKVKILECKLFVRKAKLMASVFVAHAKALELGNMKFPIRRVVCKTFTVPRGNLDFSQENLFSGQIPSRVVIGCVDNDAFNGSYTKNPFNFKHYNLTQMKVFTDGYTQHIKPIDCNFAAHQYIAGYMSLFTATGKERKDEGTDIERSDYELGYALYGFDLTPDLAEHDHFNLVREGSLRVDLKFSVPLADTINVVVYAELENVIELDRNKNVLIDYSN